MASSNSPEAVGEIASASSVPASESELLARAQEMLTLATSDVLPRDLRWAFLDYVELAIELARTRRALAARTSA